MDLLYDCCQKEGWLCQWVGDDLPPSQLKDYLNQPCVSSRTGSSSNMAAADVGERISLGSRVCSCANLIRLINGQKRPADLWVAPGRLPGPLSVGVKAAVEPSNTLLAAAMTNMANFFPEV